MSDANDTAGDAGPSTVGLFGKVATRGDFVSRRLPASFVTPWDDWLRRGMQASREQLGVAWLEHYLNTRVWRFALAAGVCGEQAWAGVLMPSVDRVGRHFPLTLANGVAGPASLFDWFGSGAAWYDELEELALTSLVPGFLLEHLDGALQAAVPLPLSPRRVTLAGHSLWWNRGPARTAPPLLICRGLPPASRFVELLAPGALAEKK